MPSVNSGSAQRRLAAIMFTDIVGYTAMMHQDEARAAAVRQQHREVFQIEHERCHGEILQYYGDGTLSIFKSAVEAVECAIAMQGAFQSGINVPLRIGIHLGDIVFEQDDVYGNGVNLASRIESLGIPGCVLISDKVNYAILSQAGIETQSLGLFEFKNIKDPVEVFSISNRGITVPERSQLKGKLKEKTRSIAVLPFVNMSADPDNEYFSDGIAEEILNALVKVEGLQVIARTSSFAFKGKNMDVREIGRMLNVVHILEGSVRKAGNRVRITAQLVSALDGTHFFSETYDRNLEDIFAVQDEIAQKITNRLRKHLGEKEHKQNLVSAPTDNLEAYENYLKGIFHFNQWGDEASRNAMPFFQKAIELQEDFGPAHSYLSICYIFQAFGGKISWAQAEQQAMVYIRRALEINAEDLEALNALTAVQSFAQWDWAGLKNTAETIISLNPGKADIFHAIATYHCINGDMESAIEVEKKGLKLDPLSVQLSFYLGIFHAWSDKLATGLSYLNKVLDVAPQHRVAIEFKGWIFLHQKQYTKAEEWFAKINPAMGYRLHRSTCLGYLYSRTNRKEKALRCLEEIQQLENHTIGHSFPIDLAVLYAGLGEVNKMFFYLEKAIRQKTGDISMFFLDPVFKAHKSDPRFQKMLDLVGTGLKVENLN